MNKMKIKNILFWIFAATALFWAVACEKPGSNSANGDPNSGEDVTYTEINGTTLSEQNTLVGLVSDSSTGKGIQGVVVSDGFSVVKTDANGVYQFPASRYAKTVFVSVPAAYEIPLDANKKPVFYKVGPKYSTGAYSYATSDSKENGTRSLKKAENGGYYLMYNLDLKWEDRMYVYPVSQSDLNLIRPVNPNFRQNYGWE